MSIIVVTGKEIEKIKGDFESYLNGLNMVGEISYSQYSELYDEGTKQIQRAYELGESELEKENAELKCECRRCVYSDCPCILSDYGKDRNGICDHFKDVFDENIELKEQNRKLLGSCEGATMMYEHLTKAKEIMKHLLDWQYDEYKKSETDKELFKVIAEAEQFLKETGQ